MEDNKIKKPMNWFNFFPVKLDEILIILGPLTLFVALSLLLRDWIVDDAGITFAYARSLASGYGLVSQPGMLPVEGYSNTLWLLCMVPFFILNLFDPYVVPKIISLICIAVTFIYIVKIVYQIVADTKLTTFFSLLCISISAPFVIWANSGLENSLYVMLIIVMLFVQLEIFSKERSLLSISIFSGIIITLISLTRPDGLMYAVIFPMTLVIWIVEKTRTRLFDGLKAGLFYLISFLTTYGAFIAFRLAYFGEYWPNTYYAKGGPKLEQAIAAIQLQQPYLEKAHDLIASLTSLRLASVSAVIIIALSAFIAARKVYPKQLLVLLITTAISAFIYIIMPNDWMGEYRFATPFFAMFFLYIFSILCLSINATSWLPNTKKIVSIAFGLAIVAVVAWKNIPRIISFSKSPIVRFETIKNEFGLKFNRYAEEIEITEASLLVPDMGGTLYYSQLKVYDLARLCDKTIARTLRKDQPAFYDYIFDSIQPTFIHTHGNWSYAADFDADKRFREQYLPIDEYQDKWIEQKTGRIMMSGNYVRKDALRPERNDLINLKKLSQ